MGTAKQRAWALLLALIMGACANGTALEESGTTGGSGGHASDAGGHAGNAGAGGASGADGSSGADASDATAHDASDVGDGASDSSDGASDAGDGASDAGDGASDGASDASDADDGASDASDGASDATAHDASDAEDAAACAAPTADCNGLAGDGCEKDLDTDSANCGACGTVCGPVGSGAAQCVSGRCVKQVTITDLVDTYVDESAPNLNLSTETGILVDTDPIHYAALVRSPGLGGIAAGATVVSAKLQLQPYDPGDDVEIYLVAEPWDVTQVTFNTFPQLGALVTSFAGTTAVHHVDITSAVQAWVSGENDGISLMPTGPNGVDMYSTESAHPPVIVVTYY